MRPNALVTGATSGIGRAIAAALSATHHVHLVGRDARELQRMVQVFPAASAHVADLRDAEAVASIAAGIEQLAVLVHSAGVLHMGTTEEMTAEQWRESMELNVLAPVELTRVLLPALRRAPGDVFLINSGLGKRTMPGAGAYSASKYALRAFADTLRQEELGNGVRVISVHPGRVATPMQQKLHDWEGREYDAGAWVRPEQVADAVLSAIELDRNAIISTLDISPMP